MEFLIVYGLWGLLGASFLAATILPLSSEVVLGYLLAHDYNIYGAVAVATLGNVLGAMVNYWMGKAGSRVLLEKIFRVSRKDIEKARHRFKKYGAISLLFAWVPGIGDPLTIVAGMLKVNFWLFLALVTIGKFLRYVLVSWAVLSF
jgi:membrane protein YqaA with SNARE-associated domain